MTGANLTKKTNQNILWGQCSGVSLSVCVRERKEEKERKPMGTVKAVNSDSWPSSRGSSILMVVLRAEREEGWLFLGYTPPPPSLLGSRSKAEDGQTLSFRQSGTRCGLGYAGMASEGRSTGEDKRDDLSRFHSRDKPLDALLAAASKFQLRVV